MSSKVSNQMTGGGRRTPLSLGPTSAQKSNQKLNNESNASDSKNRKHDEKHTNKVEKTETTAKNSSAKDTTNNVTDNKKEKTSKRDSNGSHENGHSDNKDEKIILQKEEQLKKNDKKVARESPRIKEVPVVKADANKDNNKETEKPKSTISTRSKSPDKEKDKRGIPVEKKDVQKEQNDKNKDEDTNTKNESNNKKKDLNDSVKFTTEENQPLKRASRNASNSQQVTKPETNSTSSESSVTIESALVDFEQPNDNDVEMESLLLDVDIPETATTIPTAARNSNLGRRSIKEEMKQKISTPKSFEVREEMIQETKQKISTPKSFEVREEMIQETKQKISIPKSFEVKEKISIPPPTFLPAVDVPVTSTPDGKVFYSLPPSSLRQISGRRSLRPLKEYSFQYNANYRESYRQINQEIDCTNNTSMNVTVGSESTPQNESFMSSFFSFGRGKKRALTPPAIIYKNDEIQDDAVNTNTASPKRLRLDLSGLIGLVSSPVTMLKNRLYRAKIDSSTPNKTEDIDEVDADDNDHNGDVDNVSEIATDEKQILLNQQKNEKKIEIDDSEEEQEEEEDDNNDTDNAEDDNEDQSNISIENEKSIEHLSKIEMGDEVVCGSNDADDIVVKTVKRGRCNVISLESLVNQVIR